MRRTTMGVLLCIGLASISLASEKPLQAWVDVPSPKKLYAPAPPYPAIASQARVQASIVLRVTVGADGRPADVKVERGAPGFDEVAIMPWGVREMHVRHPDGHVFRISKSIEG